MNRFDIAQAQADWDRALGGLLDTHAREGLYQPSCCMACRGDVYVVRSPQTGLVTVVDAKPVVGGLIEINFNTGSYRTLPIPKVRSKKEAHFAYHGCLGRTANVEVYEATV